MIEKLTWKEKGTSIHLPGSNFWNGGHTIPAEHEFQARKTFNLDWQVRILCAANDRGHLDPGKAKRLGRQAPLRPDWEEVKVNEMRSVIIRKALAEPAFVEWLLKTDREPIQEGNWWHDNCWGVCFCSKCEASGASHTATNHLGRILMDVRELVASYD